MKLGKTNIEISRQGLGCMSMSEFYGEPISDEQGIALIKTAYDSGVNFFDTADIYGYGRNEKLVGKAVSELIANNVRREQLVIATKCGIVRDEQDPTKRGINNSFQYVMESWENSLQRLGNDVAYIDLFYIHRIADHGTQITEAMEAMAELLAVGKIRAVGISEANAEVIRNANTALLNYTDGRHQLAAVQTEYSLMTRNPENNGVLTACSELNITFVAYSPLSRALLGNNIKDIEQLDINDARRGLPRFENENLRANQNIINEITTLVKSKGVTTAQVALAWLMHQANVVPIPGTTKLKNLQENIQAIEIELTQEEIQFLNELKAPIGLRYPEVALRTYGLDDELPIAS